MWANPDDLRAVRAWADHLALEGDGRGEFIRQSLEKPARASTRCEPLDAGTRKRVGPAGRFLSHCSFSSIGLVELAVCEANSLAEGFEHVAALNPRLRLDVSTRKKGPAAALGRLAKLPLEKIYFLAFNPDPWGGIPLDDELLLAVAPGLEGVRHLDLAWNHVTAEGLTRLAPFLGRLEFLALSTDPDHSPAEGKALANAWCDALCAPAFAGLKAVSISRFGKPDAAHVKRLRALPNLESVNLRELYPCDWRKLEALKRGE